MKKKEESVIFRISPSGLPICGPERSLSGGLHLVWGSQMELWVLVLRQGVARVLRALSPGCRLSSWTYSTARCPHGLSAPSLPLTLSSAGPQALSARCPPAFPIRLQLPQGGTVFASSLWGHFLIEMKGAFSIPSALGLSLQLWIGALGVLPGPL